MKKVFLTVAMVGLFAVSFVAAAKAEGKSASDLIADMEKAINSVSTSIGQINPENQEAAKERLTAMKNNLAAAKKAKERMGQSDCDSACQQAQMILIENAAQYVEALGEEIAQLSGKDVQYGEGGEGKDQDKKEVSEDTSKTGGEGDENKLEPPTDKEDAHAGQSNKEIAENSQNNTSSSGAKGDNPLNSTNDDKKTTGDNNDTTNNYSSKN